MTEATRPLRVFLCHSSNDKPVVRDLYRRLEAEGWMDAWLDSEKLYPGQDWNFEIEKAVEEADVILVCLTKNSVNKEGYIQRELRSVLDQADYKPEGTLFVIPVRLEECEPPRRLRTWQYADYFPENDRDRAYQRLLVSLKMRARKLGIPTESHAEVIKRLEAEEQEKKAAEELEKARLKLKRGEIELNAVLEQANEKIQYERNKNIKTEEEQAKKALQEQFNTISEVEKDALKTMLAGLTVGRRAGVWVRNLNLRPYAIGIGVLLVVAFGILGVNSLIQKTGTKETPIVTYHPLISTSTIAPIRITPTKTNTPPLTETSVPPTSTLGIGSTVISDKDGMTLMYVPAGEFTMGSDNGNADEKPAHKVTLDAFWIDQTEVTNAMYAECVADSKCEPPSNTDHFSNSSYANHPVVYVNWNRANAYCSWAQRRLPTEAEWEKAARGENAFTYPWSNGSPNKDLLNYNGDVGDTTEVGKYPDGKSIYDVLDMAGNVWEWVSDWYDVYPNGNPNASSDFGQKFRVVRGGAWGNFAFYVRSANRLISNQVGSNDEIGFRCSRSQ